MLKRPGYLMKDGDHRKESDYNPNILEHSPQ